VKEKKSKPEGKGPKGNHLEKRDNSGSGRDCRGGKGHWRVIQLITSSEHGGEQGAKVIDRSSGKKPGGRKSVHQGREGAHERGGG